MGPGDPIFEDEISGDDVEWNDGVITYVLDSSDLDLGKNFILVYYYLFDSEDDKDYEDESGLVGSDLVAITVNEEVDPELSITVDNFEEGSVGVAVIKAVESFNGDVLVQVAGGHYTVALTNGSGELPLVDLAKGNYTAVAVIEDVEGFEDSEASAEFNVTEKQIVSVDPNLTISVADITEGESALVEITTNDTFSGDVSVEIEDGVYTVGVVNGYGNTTVSNLVAKEYTAVAKFVETDKFAASTKNTTFTVSAKPVLIDPSLNIKVPNTAKSNKVVVTVTTNAAFSGTVNVKIGSKTYAVKVVKGKGTKSISGLAIGTYTAKATFKATGVFKQATKSVTFKVKADTIKLTVKKVNIKKSAKKVVIKATLKINGKNANGKKITLIFKGKKYKATTKRGVAKFTIKKKMLRSLTVGKKITYKVSYGKKTAKKTVKVKK